MSDSPTTGEEGRGETPGPLAYRVSVVVAAVDPEASKDLDFDTTLLRVSQVYEAESLLRAVNDGQLDNRLFELFQQAKEMALVAEMGARGPESGVLEDSQDHLEDFQPSAAATGGSRSPESRDKRTPDLVEAYLAENGYESIEAWARDSDYFQLANGDWTDEQGNIVDIEGCLEGAIEAMNS